MNLLLISVPYDTARRATRMGAGPEQLLRSGAADRLRDNGHRVRVEEVGPPDGEFPAEISTAFALQRAVAASVRRATAGGSFPIVLAGNCNAAAVGTLAGLGEPNVGIVWFDSHGDFNTPETTTGGFLDGMALAIATGRCWRRLVAQHHTFDAVDERNVVLVGARDLDPLEAEALDRSSVTVLRPHDVRGGITPALERLSHRVRDLYVHVDLDVLDPVAHGRANALAAPDGLSVDDVVAAIHLTAAACRVRGAGLTAYDPSYDHDGRVCQAALTLLGALADVAEASGALPAHGGTRAVRGDR